MDGHLTALASFASPGLFLLLLFGTAAGIIVGAVPGLSGAMLIALTLPLTYSMEPSHAMTLLVAMYVGAISGGLITATLLRMPGTPASIMTTLDGYPMAQRGEGGRALGLGITASLVGGLISWGFLVLLAEPMADMATKLGPFEFFSLVMMALVLIASVSGKSLSRGLLAGFAGIFVSMPGIDPGSGLPRLTFGFDELNGGLKMLPVLIGLFAISQLITDVLRINQTVEVQAVSRRGLFMSLAQLKRQAGNLLRSSLIGPWIGILPGIGANIGSVVSYSAARSLSRTPEKFGTGCDDGVIASEAANNATVGGALIPLIAMGIPGSVIDVILLGALVMHGLQAGPLLFQNNPEVVYTIMTAALCANLAMFVLMLAGIGAASRLVKVRRAYLVPAILVFCFIGAYATSNRMFDVWVMLAFGVIGFGMERMRLPLAPFVIGYVLAPIAEHNLSAALMLSAGDYSPLVTRPISLVFLLVSAALLFWPLAQRWRQRAR